jgi:hypothetical protein
MRARARNAHARAPAQRSTPRGPAQDDLEFFRLRTRDSREIIASPGTNSLVIVIQKWKTASDLAKAVPA